MTSQISKKALFNIHNHQIIRDYLYPYYIEYFKNKDTLLAKEILQLVELNIAEEKGFEYRHARIQRLIKEETIEWIKNTKSKGD